MRTLRQDTLHAFFSALVDASGSLSGRPRALGASGLLLRAGMPGWKRLYFGYWRSRWP